MRTTLVGVVLAGLAVALGVVPGRGQTEATERLLQLHHEQRVAHVLGDARLLTAMFADTLTERADGEVSRIGRETARERFGRYFESVRFLEWDDVRPPEVRVAPGGDRAEVVVEKRVRTVAVDASAGGHEHAHFTWLERWRRMDGDWRMESIASTQRSVPDPVPVPLRDRERAWEIFRRAREAVGGTDAVARVATLQFVASCRGPDGPFRTRVASAVDGRVRFQQTFEDRPAFDAGIGLDRGRVVADGDLEALDPVSESVLRAHEMHLLALVPEARFTDAVARPDTVIEGRPVHVVELTDVLGARVPFYYDVETGMPVGFRPVDHSSRSSPELMAIFADWRSVGEVRLPFEMTITQGEEVYRYQVTEASVDWLPESTFTAGSR